MKIEMHKSMAGPTWSVTAGEEIDLEDAEAARLIKAGYATSVRAAKPERATKPGAPEKAVSKAG